MTFWLSIALVAGVAGTLRQHPSIHKPKRQGKCPDYWEPFSGM
jgi:hypothetical protein